jgi:Tfp pilus assembly protein PilX
MQARFRNQGTALILALIAIVIVSAWAVSMATTANTNLQAADNHRKANLALIAADSGLEIIRYYLSGIKMPSSTPPTPRNGEKNAQVI